MKAKALTERTVHMKLLRFLKRHPQNYYSPYELSAALKIPANGTIYRALKELYDAGMISRDLYMTGRNKDRPMYWYYMR